MKKLLYILPLFLLIISCKKEEPVEDSPINTDTTTTTTLPETYTAQVILTILDSNSDPLDSVACILPFHEPLSPITEYYTDTLGELWTAVWYKEEWGGMPDSQYVSLSKGSLTDTIYVPLAGDNSTNYYTHILQ